MPTLDGGRFIRESIDSCLEQTYRDIELIIVEDGSDCLRGLINSYGDDRIKYYRNEKNMGISISLNRGFSNSRGEYLTWTSDDNIYEKNAIERMAGKLEKDKRTYFVYANFYEINEKGKVIRPVETRQPETLDYVNYIGLCFLYRRDIYEKLGGYDPGAFLVEDYEYWLRIFHNGFSMKKINEYLYRVRMHEGCLTCKYDSGYIEARAQEARDKYISEDKKAYQHGRMSFYKGDMESAKRLIGEALRLNPFTPGAWRLWLIMNMNPRLVRKIRTVKRKIMMK
jgi:glycosyltransferase involved in cell wall biosynthesis